MNTVIRWSLALVLPLTMSCDRGKTHERDDDDEHPAISTSRTDTAVSETNSVISLSAEAIAANHVQSIATRRGSAFVTTRVPCLLQFNSNEITEVHPAMEGRILEWLVDVGQEVHKGDALVRLEIPQNIGAQVTLKATSNGELTERSPVIGAWVQPAEKLAVITDASVMMAVAQVHEDLIGKILTNAPATLRVQSFPERTFTGRFLRISSQVDPETRTVEFWYTVPNTNHMLRAGMFATVTLATDRIENQLFIPATAVQSVHDHTVVFTEEQPGKYRMTAVQLGRTVDEECEILTGLGDGARVVSTGSFILKSEVLRAELTGDSD